MSDDFLSVIPGATIIPPHLPYVQPDPAEYKEGEVVLEGRVGRAFAGAFCEVSVKFIQPDDGVAVWNSSFRDLEPGRVRLIKKGEKLVWEKAVPTEEKKSEDGDKD